MYYADFFQLKEAPFSIAPNPRYLFMSERHREALAHLLYGIAHGNGFVALTGEVGTGKTTLCNCLINQLPKNIDLALILNPRVNARELLATVCDELGIPYSDGNASIKILLDRLTVYLLKAHAKRRNTVLLIDEAQNLSFHVLEQIRLLTNLETNDTKLLQIILVGQPELNELLAQANLRQLNQRITARYHMEPLSLPECRAYIEHRLRVAGCGRPVFKSRAVRKVFQYSSGIPRLINIICDRAMLGAYSLGSQHVNARMVNKAAREVLLPSSLNAGNNGPRKWAWRIALAGVVAGLVVVAFMQYPLFAKLLVQFETKPLYSAQEPTDARHKSASLDDRSKKNRTPIATAKTDSAKNVALGPDPFAAFVAQMTGDFEKPVSIVEKKVSGPLPPTAQEQQNPFRPPIDSSTQIDNQATIGMAANAESKGSLSEKNAEPSRIRFADRLQDPALTLNSALPKLFLQWKRNYDPQTNYFCEAAQGLGLRCLIQQGAWSYLLSLNVPAILEFELNRGVMRFATLIRVDEVSATFVFQNNDVLSFPISEILPYWQGQFALLWKAPPEYKFVMTAGHSSPAVPWLRERLEAKYPGDGQVTRPDFFDQELKKRVMSFQSDQGLTADGKVGAETLLLLSALDTSPDVPRLRAASH